MCSASGRLWWFARLPPTSEAPNSELEEIRRELEETKQQLEDVKEQVSEIGKTPDTGVPRNSEEPEPPLENRPIRDILSESSDWSDAKIESVAILYEELGIADRIGFARINEEDNGYFYIFSGNYDEEVFMITLNFEDDRIFNAFWWDDYYKEGAKLDFEPLV